MALSATNATMGKGGQRFVIPNPRCVTGGQGRFWPGEIYEYILAAINKGFSDKVSKRRFFGHFDNH